MYVDESGKIKVWVYVLGGVLMCAARMPCMQGKLNVIDIQLRGQLHYARNYARKQLPW